MPKLLLTTLTLFALAGPALGQTSTVANGVNAASDFTDKAEVARDVAGYAYDYLTTDEMCSALDVMVGEKGEFEIVGSQPLAMTCCSLRRNTYPGAAIVRLSSLLPWVPSIKVDKRAEGVAILAEEAMKLSEDDLKKSLAEAMEYATNRTGESCKVALENFPQ